MKLKPSRRANLRSDLIEALARLPSSWSARERNAFLTTLGIQIAPSKVVWEGNATTFYDELVSALATEGKAELCDLLEKLSKTEKVGVESRGVFAHILSSVRMMNKDEWNDYFLRKASTVDEVISQCVSGVLTSFEATIDPGAPARKVRPSRPRRRIKSKSSELTVISSDGATHIGIDTREIRTFLSAPEVAQLVRQVFAVTIYPADDQGSLANLTQSFRAYFALHTSLRGEELSLTSDRLFALIVERCAQTLERAISSGQLAAHEARSGLRHRMLQDEISAIRRSLDFLTAAPSLDIRAIIQFEERYRSQVANRHRFITPPFVDATKKVPITDIYVASDISVARRVKNEQIHRLDAEEFILRISRAVLLGNPGGGKSTFANKLCYELAKEYGGKRILGRMVTPVLVVLREYGARKKKDHISILEFIESISKSDYQISPPENSFEYLLHNGRVFIIFDGLDELLETSRRQEISNDVESFCSLYPAVPVLVTSREVGYDQSPLNVEQFTTFRLSPFNAEQVDEYVRKWFGVDSELSNFQRDHLSKSFIQESAMVPDLRSNPLMLALMCNIYKGENYIPRNRPDVYEKCATMLFERWDKVRGILFPLPFEVHVRSTMMFLAHWIFSDEALQGGVPEHSLRSKAAGYLQRHQYDDIDEAEDAARRFIEFCTGRAWVFTDTGTSADGEKLYQFTHRTFLEYFTAFHLTRIHPTPSMLLQTLRTKIAEREWDLVAQLAFQIQNKSVEGAADALLISLVSDVAGLTHTQRVNVVTFAATCLEFLVPSPTAIRTITAACVECCIAHAVEYKRYTVEESRRDFRERLLVASVDIIGSLASVATDNRVNVGRSLEQLLVTNIRGASENTALVSMEIALTLLDCLYRREVQLLSSRGDLPRSPSEDSIRFWHDLQTRILDISGSYFVSYCKTFSYLCARCYAMRLVSIEDIFNWHGVDGLFQSRGLRAFPSIGSSSVSMQLVVLPRLWERNDIDEARIGQYQEDLITFARVMLSAPLPWIDRPGVIDVFDHLYFIFRRRSFEQVLRQTNPTFPWADAMFSMFAVLAVAFEIGGEKFSREFEGWPKQADSESGLMVQHLYQLLHARGAAAPLEEGEQCLSQCGFSPDGEAFVGRWIYRDVSLVSSHKDVRGPEQDPGDEYVLLEDEDEQEIPF